VISCVASVMLSVVKMICSVAGFREHGNELLDPVNSRDVLGQLNNYQLTHLLFYWCFVGVNLIVGHLLYYMKIFNIFCKAIIIGTLIVMMQHFLSTVITVHMLKMNFYK
jgi:hypothetical protein